MIVFNSEIVEILRKELADLYIDSVLLSSCGIGFQFCDINIHCYEKVFACINGEVYEWDDSPNEAPWGNLVRQQFFKINLTSPKLLKIILKSGDYIEIETVESQYESVIIDFPPKDEKIVMEIF